MIPEFRRGQKWPGSLEQLNALVRFANSFENLRGDGLVTVTRGAAGTALGVDVDQLAYRLPRAGAGTGVAIQNHANMIGRIPSNNYSVTSRWRLTGASTATPPVWRTMKLYQVTESATLVVPSPVFGKLVGMTVATEPVGGHAAGSPTYAAYNATTGGAAPQTGAPVVSIQTGPGWGDGLVVRVGDSLKLWALFPNAGAAISVEANITWHFQEQTAWIASGEVLPDAAGVYVRNGQYTGTDTFQSCERVDGAFWLYEVGGYWAIGATQGESTNYWKGSVISATPNNAPDASTYAPQGNVSGTLTLAAHPD